MGEPEVATTDEVTTLLLSLLSSKGIVDGSALMKTGLHRSVFQQYFETIRPEIKNLTGWRSLREFVYAPPRRDTWREDEKNSVRRTGEWHKVLAADGLADEKAVQIFDGETMHPPAPDYRLFLLRDGRLLYYVGGFHADSWRAPSKRYACGDALSVLDVMGDGGHSFDSSSTWRSFMIIMSSMNAALEASIKQRQKLLDDQLTLHRQLTQLVSRIA